MMYFVLGPPDPPLILSEKSEIAGRNLTVLWRRPRDKSCAITMYSLRYRVVKPTYEKWIEINMTNVSVTSYELHLRYSKAYKVTVFAWNTLGRSQESEALDIKTTQCK